MNKIRYNSPAILTFSIIAVGIHLIDSFLIREFTIRYFVVRPSMSLLNPLDYFRLISHVLGHANWNHLIGNLTYMLLLGPMLEEKYGTSTILSMMLITAFSTGVINMLLFSTGLLGASGIVFMLIILASIADIRRGSIPLTFLLVASIFMGGEILKAFRSDNISQMAHIVGGISGAVCGFLLANVRREA